MADREDLTEPAAPEERRRAAAQAYGDYLRQRTPQQVEEDRMFIESSNDVALRDSQW